jgi:hypothetical protein
MAKVVEQVLTDFNHEKEKWLLIQIDLEKNEIYIERELKI